MKELLSKKFLCLIVVLIGSGILVSGPGQAADEHGNQPLLQLVGVGPSNNLEVVWSQETDEGRYAVYYSMYDNKAWQPKQVIVQSDNALFTPCIGGNGQHGSMLVWSEKNQTSTDLQYSLYKNGAWTSAQKIETNMVSNLSPSLLVDARNTTWMAWVGSQGGDDDIFVSKWNGSSWSTPVQVNDDNDTPDLFPVLGMDSGGQVWIQWYGYENGKYSQFRKDWNGTAWQQRQEMTGRAVALAGLSLNQIAVGTTVDSTSEQNGNGQAQTSVNLPEFIANPERATIHVLGSSTGIQDLPLRDFYGEQ